VDMGIAMSHFELAARETGLDGTWKAGNTGFGGTKPSMLSPGLESRSSLSDA